MITTKEFNISNKSYINKDFATIYPELISIVKNLTNRWDPETSNESDPGIVLLKLLAFRSDVDSYNTDKNMLENFAVSATQETSMRNLCELVGYNMGYYKAATTTIAFTYTGTDATFTLKALETVVSDIDNSISFVLTENCSIPGRNQTQTVTAIQGTKKSLTVLGSSTITLDNITNNRIYFPEAYVAENGVFIKGGNGLSADTTGYWTKVNNLNNKLAGYKYFKFSYDSVEGLPYIEFPNDIADLIGDGLTIDYIVTDGINGNIPINFITTIQSPTTLSVTDNLGNTISFEGDNNGGVLTIKNTTAATNGSDKETVTEAYNNLKKIVGTFDTLVTCRDYRNAIYNLYDNSTPLVSNCQVTDRRDDYNYSSLIQTFSSSGELTTINEIKDDAGNKLITPYDICLYPLQNINTYINYNLSFKPESSTDVTQNIELGLEDNKTISHDYKYLSFSDQTKKNNFDQIYCFKNYYKLNAKITTTYKVDTYERLEIINNITVALKNKFNAREVDYGYELSFDMLLETIEEADERIKSVSLMEPEIKTVAMNGYYNSSDLNLNNGEVVIIPYYNDEDEEVLTDTSREIYTNLCAKNILAGRVSLFNYDDRFSFDFGQEIVDSNTPMVLNSIEHIETHANISIKNGKDYKLKSNEVIQLIGPNLVNEINYTYGINYHYENTNEENYIYEKAYDSAPKLLNEYLTYYTKNEDGSYSVVTDPVTTDWESYYVRKSQDIAYIVADTEHELTSGELLYINYIDSNDVEYYIEYTANTVNTYILKNNIKKLVSSESNVKNIFKSNFDIKDIETKADWNSERARYMNTPIYKTINGEYVKFFTLGVNESLAKRKLSEVTLSGERIPCYWLTNDSKNRILWDEDGSYLLQENEYFFYSDANYTDLVSLGSGTILKKGNSSIAQINLDEGNWIVEKVNVVDILENGGLLALKNKWVALYSKSDDGFKIIENQILTLTTNDTINISQDVSLDNTFESLVNKPEIVYKLSTEDSLTTLNNYNIVGDDYCWKIKSRLDLNCGPNLEQALLDNQVIKVYYSNTFGGTTITGSSEKPIYIKTSSLLQTAGRDNISLIVVATDGSSTYPVCLYNYYKDSDHSINRTSLSNYVSLTIKNSQINGKDKLELTIPNINTNNFNTTFKDAICMIYVSYSSDDTKTEIELPISIENATISLYNDDSELSSIKSGLNIIKIVPNTNKELIKLTLDATGVASDILANITFGQLNIINSGLNPDLMLDKYTTSTFSAEEKVLTSLKKLATVSGKDIFYYNFIPNNSKIIDFTDEDYFASPYCLFNYNNIANKFVISEIDFENSDIDVAKSSRV